MAYRKGIHARWLLVLGLAFAAAWAVLHGRPRNRPDHGRDERESPRVPPHPKQVTAPSAASRSPLPRQPQGPDPTEPVPDVPSSTAGKVDALTPFAAARILGCRPQEVSRLLDGRPAALEYVEQLAVEHYPWRAHVDDPDSYWVTLKQAAAILGVSTQRVKQDLDRGQVPFVVHRSGVRLMRRAELEKAASAEVPRELRSS